VRAPEEEEEEEEEEEFIFHKNIDKYRNESNGSCRD